MAVAVDDHDIARTDQCLHRHLVRRRRAIGDKEDLIGPEGARRFFLSLLDVAGRLEQAVETSRGRAALGEEEVWTVEFAHVANPVRPEDGLATGDGERVERSDRALGVFLEIVEERRFEAILNAFQDGKMQLEQLLHRVEDAANDIGLGIARQLLHVPVRDQIDVELGANALQRARQRQRRVGHLLAFHRGHQGAQHRRVVPGVLRKAFVDDDGTKIRIEHRGTERVLETACKDRLIDESIHRTTQLPPLGCKVGPVRRGDAGDNQGLEIRPPRAGLAKSRRQQIRHFSVGIRMRIPIADMLAERARLQRLRDAHRQRERACRITRGRALGQGRHQAETGIGMIFFGDRQLRKFFLETGAIS